MILFRGLQVELRGVQRLRMGRRVVERMERRAMTMVGSDGVGEIMGGVAFD